MGGFVHDGHGIDGWQGHGLRDFDDVVVRWIGGCFGFQLITVIHDRRKKIRDIGRKGKRTRKRHLSLFFMVKYSEANFSK